MTLSELREALEEADGPSRELDAKIAIFFGEEHGPKEWVCIESRSIDYAPEIACPYTSSLDAAVGLVERVLPGWAIELEKDTSGEWVAALIADDDPFTAPCLEKGESAALALCLALTRAMETETG